MLSVSQYLAMLETVTVIALLGFAAWRDILTRTIPDTVSIALIVVGCTTRCCYGWEALVTSLLVGVVVFFVLLPACSRGLLGGADLKLLAALAMGFSPQTTLHLLAAVTIVGGGLAAVYVCLNRMVGAKAAGGSRRKPGSLLPRVVGIECWRIRRSAPLPYGIAIAIGAAIVVLNRQGV